MSTQCDYLYGVVPANGSRHFGPIGIKGSEVRAVPHGDLAMIAGSAERISFAELPAEKALGYLAEHQRVLEHVMADLPIIPLKFGTYADDQEQIIGILESGRSELTRALKNYAGKVEMDVAASWADLQAVLGELAGDEAVVSMKAEIASEAGATMDQRIRLGQLVKNLLGQLNERVASRLVIALQSRWPNFAVNPTKDDSMVLNAAILIDRGQEDQFDQIIQELNRDYENRLSFRCVGPLPPYSFATAEVKTTSAGDLDAARKVLELAESASLAEIKASHRRLLREYHPDKNPHPEAADKVKEVSAAYELLERYALNAKHTFNGAANTGAAVVKIRSIAELREELVARAA
jgi:DnaJ-domain-containing protein 1